MMPEIAPELLAIRDATEPAQRHFWIDISREHTTISRADLIRNGTFEELEAVADYLKVKPPHTLALVSTSVHLRRVRFCCSRIPFFQQSKVLFWPVPESEASPRRNGWWKSPEDCAYLCTELGKLAGYHLVYR